MTELIIRRFVGTDADPNDRRVRERYGAVAGAVGIAANTLLCAVKFLIGLGTGSLAVQADAVNNLADIGSNLVTLVGARLAAKPATKEHPYGHARMEYIAALAIAFLIVAVGFGLAKEAVIRIISPSPVEFSLLSMGMLGLSIGVKLWMGLFTANIGRRIDSATMAAATADSLLDCASTAAILISSVICRASGVNLDGYIGALVAGLVLYSGVKLVRETVSPLLGEAPSPEFIRELEERIEAYPGILGTHDILVHSYGPGIIIATAHAEVPAEGDMLKSHELIDRVENEVGREMGMMLTIHIDPVELNNPQANRARAAIQEIIDGMGGLRFHDFRMVPGEKRCNLIFDIVVPMGTTAEAAEGLVRHIRKKAAEFDETYACIVNVDYDYVGVG